MGCLAEYTDAYIQRTRPLEMESSKAGGQKFPQVRPGGDYKSGWRRHKDKTSAVRLQQHQNKNCSEPTQGVELMRIAQVLPERSAHFTQTM